MLRMSADLLLPWVGCANAPVDVEDVARAFARARLRGEVGDRLGDVGGQDADAKRRALAIELFELLRRNAIRRRTLLAPRAVPDARAGQHGVGVDRIHADAQQTAFLGKTARQVDLRRL